MKKVQFKATSIEILNQHYDPKFAKHMAEDSLAILVENYFRASISGFENLPEKEEEAPPRIFFSNHSGMAFPWDAIIFGLQYWKHFKFQDSKTIRALVAPLLLSSKIMNPFLIDNLWRRLGGVDATMPNFEGLMQKGDQDVLIFPEGVQGIGKGFDKRYQIQKFSMSFLRMAVKYKAELIPYYSINAEFIHPFAYKNDKLNRIVQKMGIPMIPLSPITALTPILPFLFYFSMPAKLKFVIGKPINIYDEFEGRDPDSIKRSEYVKIRDKIQTDYQNNINKYVNELGQDPYEFDEFIDKMKEN